MADRECITGFYFADSDSDMGLKDFTNDDIIDHLSVNKVTTFDVP